MARLARTTDPISVALPRLLADADVSFRELGRATGISQSYFSRIRGPKHSVGWRPPSKKLLEAVADELGIEPDFFPEYRRIVVEEAIEVDGRLRDRFYDAVRRQRP